jgi:cytochrome c oxidase subunit I
VPRQAGGKLISDSYTRAVFILFLLLSIPTGLPPPVHGPGDQQHDEGDARGAHLRRLLPEPGHRLQRDGGAGDGRAGARRHGAARLDPRLPWGDPSLTAQLLAMLTFVYGGATGLVNASFTMNLVIHNTTWVPGHFHMTVGTAVR